MTQVYVITEQPGQAEQIPYYTSNAALTDSVQHKYQ